MSEGDGVQIQLENRKICEGRRAARCTKSLKQSTMIEHLHRPRLQPERF
jgi:hypothetical protein